MTLQDFINADMGVKLNTIKAKGVFIGKLITNDEYLTCYAIDKFFVEVLFDTNFTEVLGIRPFVGGRQLDKYSNLDTEI